MGINGTVGPFRIISDGGDDSRRYTEGEVKNLVRESDVPIYANGVFEADNAPGRTPRKPPGRAY